MSGIRSNRTDAPKVSHQWRSNFFDENSAPRPNRHRIHEWINFDIRNLGDESEFENLNIDPVWRSVRNDERKMSNTRPNSSNLRSNSPNLRSNSPNLRLNSPNLRPNSQGSSNSKRMSKNDRHDYSTNDCSTNNVRRKPEPFWIKNDGEFSHTSSSKSNHNQRRIEYWPLKDDNSEMSSTQSRSKSSTQSRSKSSTRSRSKSSNERGHIIRTSSKLSYESAGPNDDRYYGKKISDFFFKFKFTIMMFTVYFLHFVNFKAKQQKKILICFC